MLPNLLSADIDKPLEEKLISTKELSEVLEVPKQTIANTVNRLDKVLGQVKKNNQGGFLFNEEQATLIKQEIQKHHNLASRQIDTVSTEYEMELMTQKVMAYHIQKANEYKLRMEQAEKTVQIQAPKVEVFDKICDSVNLIEIGDFGKISGLAIRTFIN